MCAVMSRWQKMALRYGWCGAAAEAAAYPLAVALQASSARAVTCISDNLRGSQLPEVVSCSLVRGNVQGSGEKFPG